ncbi:MAG TPA: hypothetical protein VMZ28_21055 [Kofleriaceae bacterium]|nr:hypothetical protein [Kofleriaceae bacterium]
MKRIGLVLGASLLCGAFAVSGCKKDEKKEDATKTADPAAAGEMADKKGDEASAGGAGATPTPTGTDSAAMPPTGDGAGANVAAVAPSAEEQALAEKAAQLMDDMGKVAEAAGDNCDKAAADLKVLLDKAKPVLEAGKKFKDDEGKKKWFEEKYGARMMGSMTKLMPLIQKCENHEGLNKLFQEMQ